jgi:hypothetical protein
MIHLVFKLRHLMAIIGFVETWWLGHVVSTVLDINYGSIDIKSPPY